MARKHEGALLAGKRIGAFLISGALAAALTPGLAFGDNAQTLSVSPQQSLQAQHYDPEYVDLAVIGNNGDPLTGGVKVVRDWDGSSIQYMGYAHGDGSHYKGYSIYTDITVDAAGNLVALDITSGTDTFAGKWGYNNVTVEGLLPAGVSFSATAAGYDNDGNAIWMPALSGADGYGYALSSVTLLSVNGDGTADARGIDQNFDGSRQIQSGRSKVAAPKYTSTAVKPADDGSIKIPKSVTAVAEANTTTTTTFEDEDYYNLVQCTYTLGTQADKTQFNTYFMTGGAYMDAADTYLDNIKKTAYSENPTTGYTTNRDGWTSIMGTMVLRQLGSWGAYLKDASAVTGGLDGELASVDTVSGATKTSMPFINALNAAKDAGYIKGVAEDVVLTIDGANAADAASLPKLVINNDADNNSFQDYVTVTKGDDGLYSLVGGFNKTGSGGRLSLDAIWLVNAGDQKLGTQGIMALAKEIPTISNYEYYQAHKGEEGVVEVDEPWCNEMLVAGYHPAAFNVSGEPHLIGFGTKVSEMTPATSFKVSNAETIELDASQLDFSYMKASDSKFDFLINVKNPAVTHVAITYTLGHAKATTVYDLAEQEKVPDASALMAAATADNPESVSAARAAYDALTFDVKPYTTGLSNLIAAENQVVANAAVEAIANAATPQDAVDAYNALTDAQKQCVDGTTAMAVVNAQAALAANAAAEAAAAKAEAETAKTAATTAQKEAADAKAAATKAQNEAKTAKAEAATAKAAVASSIKANPMTVTAKTVTVKAKKKTSVAAKNAFTVKGAQGKVSYYKISGNAKITVSAKGKVTVKKGLKKGKTVKAKVLVVAAGGKGYAPATKTVTLKVKVK